MTTLVLETGKNEQSLCPVCFEVIGLTNNCITPCGHTFCLICMLKCIKKNNTCPCCRTMIIEEDENSDGDGDDDDDDDDAIFDYDDSDDTPDDYNTENEPFEEPYQDHYLVSLDKIADVLKTRGYTILDILHCSNSNMVNTRLNTRLEISSLPKFTYKQFQDIICELDEEMLNEELLRESNENKLMMENDNKPQINHLLCDYVSLDKMADELEKRGYTLLNILQCLNCPIFNYRFNISSLPNKSKFEFYDIIDELDEEKSYENIETIMMMKHDFRTDINELF
jgi:hypothetical protein